MKKIQIIVLMHLKMFFVILIAATTAFASQEAVIVKNRSLIYADKMLTSPIGYLQTGRKVRVGDVPRNNGRVLPILLKGKVGYVEVKNLSFDTESVIAKNRMKAFHEERTPKLYLNYSYNISGLGDQWSQLSQAQNESGTGNMTGHRFDLEIHPPSTKAFGTIGIGYASLTQSQLAISTYTFIANFYYSVLKFRHLTLDLMTGIELSPQTKVQVRGAEESVAGTTYGWQYGAQIRMMYNLRYGFVAGYYIKNTKAEKLVGIPQVGSSQTHELTSFSGSNIYLGLSYRFK